MANDGWMGHKEIPGLAVRVEVQGGRAIITGVRFEKSTGVTGSDLRAIPLVQIESLLNGGGRDGDKHGRADLLAALGHRAPDRPTPAQLRLKVPDHGRYPDGFYEKVADLHRRLTANKQRPVTALAAANGVPASTVHRWVKEARARGLLAPSRQGSK